MKILDQQKFSTQTAQLISASYASSTWKRHDSALNSLKLFWTEKNITPAWPVSREILAEYITWAYLSRKLKSATISNYLDSLRTVHMLRGLQCSQFEDYIIKSVIRGGENLELMNSEVKATRKVMSLQLLKLLGDGVSKCSWEEESKQVVWAACTTAFFGSFRFGELLSKRENTYSPADSLLWSDVKFLDGDHILIHIRNPKSKMKEGEFVDIFKFDGHGVCPVKALKKLAEMRKNKDMDSPVFSFSTGKCLTQRNLNQLLEDLLFPYIGEESKQITGHSFRAAIPAVLAKFPEVANSAEIMGWGRWKSEAYLCYTRLKKDQKRATFKKITNLFNM